MSLIFCLGLIIVACTSNDKKSSENKKNLIAEKPIKNLGCPIQGTAPMWENIYCRMKTGIKDRASKALRPCEMELIRTLRDKTDCQKITHLKEQVCGLQIRLGYYEKGPITCMEDRAIEAQWISDYK